MAPTPRRRPYLFDPDRVPDIYVEGVEIDPGPEVVRLTGYAEIGVDHGSAAEVRVRLVMPRSRARDLTAQMRTALRNGH